MYDVKIVADSVNRRTEDRLTTFECTYPRIIHEEVLTHAALSLVTASSRAVPTKDWVYALESDPFIPAYWGKNESGMVASGEIPEFDQIRADDTWRNWISLSVHTLVTLNDLGVHKQIANRPPHAATWITSVLSGTEWMNFFGLRYHEAAQPEFQCLAAIMWDEYQASVPVRRLPGEWHLPYITDEERLEVERSGDGSYWELALRSTARCGRVSYFRQGQIFERTNELDRANSFIQQRHWSTTEFAAVAQAQSIRSGNLIGWQPIRKFYAEEAVAPFQPPEVLPGRYQDIRQEHWTRKHG